jgi:threonine synthase
MDISKASNFERFIFDAVDRDARTLRELFGQLAAEGGFSLTGTPHWVRVQAANFVSGRSTHGDRLATIRDVHARYGLVIDPHTADGIKVGRDHRDRSVPLICVETALPVKFTATIREALGREPDRPAVYAGLEGRPQRSVTLPADAGRVMAYVAEHAAG